MSTTPYRRVSSLSSARKLGPDRVLAHVGAGRLEDDRGHVVVGAKGLFDKRDVVRLEDDHRAGGLVGDAAVAGTVHDRVVVPAVEVLSELDDLRLARVGAHHPEGHHRGLRSGAVEPHLLRARHQLLYPARPLDLLGRGGAVVRAPRHLLRDGLDDCGMRVAQQQRAVARPVVDQALPVEIELVRALRVGHVVRERRQVSGVVRDAVGEDIAGLRELFGAFRMQVDVALLDWADHDAPALGSSGGRRMRVL